MVRYQLEINPAVEAVVVNGVRPGVPDSPAPKAIDSIEQAMVSIPPGQTKSIAVADLEDRSEMSIRVRRLYWTKPGEYSVTATLRLAFSPPPEKKAGAGNVTLTSNTVKLKVVDPKDAKVKTDPPGVPLELKLVAKKDTYMLDLGGKTREQFKEYVDKIQLNSKDDVKKLPTSPAVDLALEVRNTGDKEAKLAVEGDDIFFLHLKGPGVVDYAATKGPGAGVGIHEVKYVNLAAGATHVIPIRSLTTTSRGPFVAATSWEYRTYWTKPGEYTLKVSYNWSGGYFLAPGAALTSNAVKLKVVAPEKKEPGKEKK